MTDYLLLLFNETKAKFLTIAVVDCNSGCANSSNCPQNDGRRTGSKFTWVSLEASVWLQVLFIYFIYLFIYLFGVAFSYIAERTVQDTLLSYASRPLPLPFSASFDFFQLLNLFGIQHSRKQNVVSHTWRKSLQWRLQWRSKVLGPSKWYQ